MKTIGGFEYVDLPLLGIEKIKAKIDTGAGVCAIHSTMQDIVVKNGIACLIYNVMSPNLILTTNKYKKINITNSFGDTEQRYQVSISININGELYDIDFTLTDRSDMDCKVLIGKNLIDLGNFVVDVKKVPTINESVSGIISCDNCSHQWEKNKYSVQPNLCIGCGFDNQTGKFFNQKEITEDATSTALYGGGNYFGQMPSYPSYDKNKWKEFPSDEMGIIARRMLTQLVKDCDGNLEKALDQFAFSNPDLLKHL
jgi:hypothetical protein